MQAWRPVLKEAVDGTHAILQTVTREGVCTRTEKTVASECARGTLVSVIGPAWV